MPPWESSDDELSSEIAVWLEKVRLGHYTKQARAWCNRMGAVHVSEVLENWEEFAGDLNLKRLERKRVEKTHQDLQSNNSVAVDGSSVGKAATTTSTVDATSTRGADTEKTRPSMGGGSSASDSVLARRGADPTGYFGPQEDPKKYAIMEELGQGATATVHRCVFNKKCYAVKTINLARLRLQPGFERITDKMRREVSILFSLRHPRIVSLFDVIEVPDGNRPEKLHLVMELVQGGELLNKIVQLGALREIAARYVFLQVTEGLKYVHSRDVVYRDLKPENILCDERASRQELIEIKLSDFGHSKLINDGYSTAVTRVGTPQYWAPEVSDPALAARGYDQQVDLWSLGIVLYVMLMGRYPFDGLGCSIEEQIQASLSNFGTNALGLEVSEPAQDLVGALVKVDPASRLALERCLCHPWVSREGGSISKLLKLCADSNRGVVEERIALPGHLSKAQVEVLRRDLHTWMTKFRCSAKLIKEEIVTTIDPDTASQEAALSELRQIAQFSFQGMRGKGPPRESAQKASGYPRPDHIIKHKLRVHPDHGAGLDLAAQYGGMLIEKIYPKPGQPGLAAKDLIISIDAFSLSGGSPEHVEAMFRRHFRDGAELTVRRNR